MTERPDRGQHLAPGAQLPPKPAGVPATPKPAEPRDLAWARRCAQDYQANPTDARARNAAQCLPGILAAYDAIAARAADLDTRLRFAGVVWPAGLCLAPHPAQARPDLKCFLAAGHEGDHSTNAHPGPRTWRNLKPGGTVARQGMDAPPEINLAAYAELNAWHQHPALCKATTQGRNEKLVCDIFRGHAGPHSDGLRDPEGAESWNGPAGERGCGEPPELCPGFPRARPEDARLACFKPVGHLGEHSNAPEWLRVGIDPCPARSHQQESCVKGYLHAGAHEWGPTRPIEAGPELPLGETEPDRAPHNCRCVVGYQPAAGPQPWDKCPNTPQCEHPAAYHDIESLDDPRYMCCEQGCPCGAVILVDPTARISLTEQSCDCRRAQPIPEGDTYVCPNGVAPCGRRSSNPIAEPPEQAVGASEPHPEG